MFETRPSEIITSGGSLRGAQGEAVHAFLGVPYARDPIGKLRFAAPEPVPAWTGVRNATTVGPAFPQAASRLESVMGGFPARQHEAGGLHVNVWTPDPRGTYPVLVWFHGGGWATGSAAWSAYNGAALAAREQVVVVTVNFRIGALGYAAFERGVCAGAGDVVTENVALLDQAAALEWVSQCIPSFGGDPGNVTVGGQSAGAEAALLLAVLPRTRNLMHGVIAQSAPVGSDFAGEEALEVTAELMGEMGLDLAAIDELRNAPAVAIVEAYRKVLRKRSRPGSLMPPLRVTRGPALPWRNLTEAVQAAWPSGLPLLAGSTAEETRAFFDQDPRIATFGWQEAEKTLEEQFGADRTDLHPVSDLTPGEWFARVGTEMAHTRPTLELVEAVSGPGFAYLLDGTFGPFGACHCIDLPLLFGPHLYEGAPMLAGVAKESLEAAHAACTTIVGEFVRRRDPGWAPHTQGATAHRLELH